MADDSIISAPADIDGAAPTTDDSGRSNDGKPKPWFKRLSLTTWIFIALILGVLAGLALQGAPEIADTYIKPFGTIFLNLIKMIVVPLVLFSMLAGCGGCAFAFAGIANAMGESIWPPPPAPLRWGLCSPTS